MSITAALVKDLRMRTGAGMMECKKALVETDGDIELAIENMRKAGMAQADKKAGRVATEGMVMCAVSDCGTKAAIVEVNSETDFVAKGDAFIAFTDQVAQLALNQEIDDIDSLLVGNLEGGVSVEEARRVLIAKLGENISVRRVAYIEGSPVGQYSHGSKIGVLVALNGGDVDLGKEVAMHVAATNPQAVDQSGVDDAVIEHERAIFSEQALQSGKPPEIADKMVVGKIAKFLKEITLLNQPFVKNPDISVQALLKQHNAAVTQFIRFEVGEGIAKKEDNFAEEVAAQVAAAK